MRYRLRTLLIVLTLGPPVLAWIYPMLEWFRRPRDDSLHNISGAATRIYHDRAPDGRMYPVMPTAVDQRRDD